MARSEIEVFEKRTLQVILKLKKIRQLSLRRFLMYVLYPEDVSVRSRRAKLDYKIALEALSEILILTEDEKAYFQKNKKALDELERILEGQSNPSF